MNDDQLRDRVRALLKEWVAANAPSEGSERRVQLAISIAQQESKGVFLPGFGAQREGAEQRIRARLREPLRQPRPRFAAILAGSSILAAGVLITQLSLWGEPVSKPGPLPSPLVPPPTLPLAASASHPPFAGPLARHPAGTAARSWRHVALRYEGVGALEGTESSATISWRSGRIDVEVEPNRGVQLTVATPDAEIEVVGTVFSVESLDGSTVVDVTRGSVRLRCLFGGTQMILGGFGGTCQGESSAAALISARRSLSAGAPLASLSSIDAVLDRAAGPLGSELRFVRVEALVSLGRSQEAIVDLHEYLADEAAPRRTDAGNLLRDLQSRDPSAPSAHLLHESGAAAQPWSEQ